MDEDKKKENQSHEWLANFIKNIVSKKPIMGEIIIDYSNGNKITIEGPNKGKRIILNQDKLMEVLRKLNQFEIDQQLRAGEEEVSGELLRELELRDRKLKDMLEECNQNLLLLKRLQSTGKLLLLCFLSATLLLLLVK